jgi:hypothetical protein
MSLDLAVSAFSGGKDQSDKVAATRPTSALSQSTDTSSRRHNVALEAQPYFDQHKLIEVIQALLAAVIKDKPADPYAFMIRVLQNSAKAAGGEMKSSKPSRPQSATVRTGVVTAPVDLGNRPQRPKSAMQWRAPSSGTAVIAPPKELAYECAVASDVHQAAAAHTENLSTAAGSARSAIASRQVNNRPVATELQRVESSQEAVSKASSMDPQARNAVQQAEASKAMSQRTDVVAMVEPPSKPVEGMRGGLADSLSNAAYNGTLAGTLTSVLQEADAARAASSLSLKGTMPILLTPPMSRPDPVEVEYLRESLRTTLSDAAATGSLPRMLSEADAAVAQRGQTMAPMKVLGEVETLRSETTSLKTRTEQLEGLVTKLITDNDRLRNVVVSRLEIEQANA